LIIEPPFAVRSGSPEVEDDLSNVTGELSNPWTKVVGDGRFVGATKGVTVHASRRRPNPGRTVYARPWHHSHHIDASVDVISPGSRVGVGHRTRGGLCIWQDNDNYIVVNLFRDDNEGGGSVSCFARCGGREGFYDAVWSRVGDRISPGGRNRLRVVSDGLHVTAYLDGSAVLYRSIRDMYPDATPLAIRAIGLCANWEWGNDTGSSFVRFSAAGPETLDNIEHRE
jgi:hypothetical protein